MGKGVAFAKDLRFRMAALEEQSRRFGERITNADNPRRVELNT